MRATHRRRLRVLAGAALVALTASCASTAQVGSGEDLVPDQALGTTGGVSTDGSTGATLPGTTGIVAGDIGGGSTGGGAATAGGTTGGSTTGGATTTGGTTGSSIAVPSGQHAPGVTATTVKIGFIVVDPQTAATTTAAFGAPTDGGDPYAQVDAVVKYLNGRGGIAGRKIIAVVRDRKTSGNSGSEGQAFCELFTNDEKVFAVVTNYRIDEGVEACFAKRHTLFINDGLEPEHILEKVKPYVWVPGLPTTDDGYKAYVDGLAAQKFFGVGKLGLLMSDSPDHHLIYKNVVLPRITAAGGKVHSKVDLMDPETDTDQAEWARQIQGAMLKFRDQGVDHVMFMAPGAGVPIIFMNQAESQAYHPKYGLSSFDSPGFLIQKAIPPTQLQGAVGAGFNMIVDVDGQRGDPFPSGKGEQQCVTALGSQAGQTRGGAYNALFICDGAFMLHQVGQALTGRPLTTEGWAAAAAGLGRSFQAAYALPNGTHFRPGSFVGGATYRNLAYDVACGCFKYNSTNRPIPA